MSLIQEAEAIYQANLLLSPDGGNFDFRSVSEPLTIPAPEKPFTGHTQELDRRPRGAYRGEQLYLRISNHWWKRNG